LLLRGFVCTFSNHVWTLCRKRTFLDCGSYFISETGWDGGLNFCDGVGWQGRVAREKNLLPTFKNSWVKVLQVLEVLPLEYTSVTLRTTCIASGLCVLCACVLYLAVNACTCSNRICTPSIETTCCLHVQQLHSHAELCHPSACRQTDKRQTTHQAPEACPSYSFHATCMHTHTVHMYAGIQYTCTHKNTPPNERAVWEPWGSCVVCNGAMAECLRTAHHLEFINLAVVCNDPTMHAMHACAHVQAPTTFKTEYSPPCYLAMYRYVSYMYLARSIQVCSLFLV